MRITKSETKLLIGTVVIVALVLPCGVWWSHRTSPAARVGKYQFSKEVRRRGKIINDVVTIELKPDGRWTTVHQDSYFRPPQSSFKNTPYAALIIHPDGRGTTIEKGTYVIRGKEIEFYGYNYLSPNITPVRRSMGTYRFRDSFFSTSLVPTLVIHQGQQGEVPRFIKIK